MAWPLLVHLKVIPGHRRLLGLGKSIKSSESESSHSLLVLLTYHNHMMASRQFITKPRRMNLGEFETNVTCLQDFVDLFFEQVVLQTFWRLIFGKRL